MFQRRIAFIKRQLDTETTPMQLVSRDHKRTNKNGVNLEQLENMESLKNMEINPFKKERNSVDARSKNRYQSTKKLEVKENQLGQRRMT